MVGKFRGDNSGDILVEFDYNNIILVDPNKINNNGKVSERLVDHENLVMFVNLEADVLPRTKLAIGEVSQDNIRKISVSKINFLKPNDGKFLTNGYYDELTGKNSLNNQGQNQMKELVNFSDNKPYYRDSVFDQNNITDNGLLGITSINITTNSSFVPSVKMELEDVQGKALFQLGNDSPYSAFFNLPYPQFYLTIKGYYGQAIRYQLNLEKFSARFNSFSGNYQITLEFRGYKFNILNEISMGHLLATPHMYRQTFGVSQSLVSPQTGLISASSEQPVSNINVAEVTNQEDIVTQVTTERGYQKIKEVYSEYKSKGLISKDLPELTLVQLMNKLQRFEDLIVDKYPKSNLEPLTNIRSYKTSLSEFYNSVRASATSWYVSNLDTSPIVLKNKNKVYTFKKSLINNEEDKNKSIEKLKSLIIEYNKLLDGNETLGKKSKNYIKNSISYDMIYYQSDFDSIDWVATTIEQTGIQVPTDENINRIKNYYRGLFGTKVGNINGELVIIKPDYYIFEGDRRFDKEISSMESQANKKLNEFEISISEDLARRFEDSTFGIGFKPTVRNIVAVIMASAEGFIKLMDDVHTNAWNVRYDPIRKNAILNNPSSVQGSDTVDKVDVTIETQQSNDGLSNSKVPVYPWPQFFTETNDDKRGRYQLTYIADPSVVDLTQGYLYDKWPEVEFVEEYLKGITLKFNSPDYPDTLENDRYNNIININAIEYPQRVLPYLNKSEIKFFYEIWERQFITSNYSGFGRLAFNTQLINELLNLNSQSEVTNIVGSLGVSSPYLTYKLKNFGLNSQNYVSKVLENLSNQGTGKSYQEFIRDVYVTNYLKNITESTFSILSVLDLGSEPQESPQSSALQSIVKSSNNDPMIVDTLPFTSPSWVSTNMESSKSREGNEVYNTNNTLKVYGYRNLISNFTDIYNFTENRPVTNFSFYNIRQYENNINLKIKYAETDQNRFVATEGNVYYNTPTSNLIYQKTTSVLNTPYFINSILSGVYENRRNNLYPYIKSAYLFINSLPLATLREKYKTYSSGDDVTTELDYISSVFKKYGAIHKVPYVWVLKFGSIWYRYKKFIETNVDILDDIWKEFDYVENYSPIEKSKTQTYDLSYNVKKINITLEKEDSNTIDLQVGFYPKVINDFNYFYNGYDYYFDYTTEEIQESINNGLKIYNFGESNINGVKSGEKVFNETTWSILTPKINELKPKVDCEVIDNTVNGDYFIIPSFGSNINQTYDECVSSGGGVVTSNVKLTDNSSIYNGSVRMLWGASNYGYFDSDAILKPTPNQYLNRITTEGKQSPFKMLDYDGYSNIEEIFAVFDKEILDQFEKEFLNFSKSADNASIDDNENNSKYKNFQILFRSLMSVGSKTFGTDDQTYFNQVIASQFQNFQQEVKSFMEYDVILRYGNPTNFNRRVFNSYLSHLSNNNLVTDPIKFNPYVPNTLPTKNGSLTLSNSKNQNSGAWKALELYVGFSTINGVSYTDQGSYITDFFVDNNIEFSETNVILLSPIIKMYATQKLINPNLNRTDFQQKLNEYLGLNNSLQSIFLNDILSKVQNALPDQQQLPERKIQSVIDGQQGKVETYELFKGLNDKWISGTDFREKTLFEDFLFLDRASRDVGDTILIDIFDLRNMFSQNSLNSVMSVFTFVSGILIKNNFTVMNLPAYVNFYNIQDVDGSALPKPDSPIDFANNLWGTFLNVDYRKSSPKIICFYVGRPSEYLDLPKGNFKYRDDGIDIRKTQNPMVESLTNKKDYSFSNKCVGFNVDIGVRNQNIFYSFSVAQDPGIATSESINTLLNMVQEGSGRSTATQNNSIYNLYKNRSYQCVVESLGNALIQPTMYFNLRHVPMFSGPYLITQVEHSIQPGTFITKFNGIRQGLFDLPTLDKFIQSVNKNLLTRVEEIIKNKKNSEETTSTTNNQKSQNLPQNSNNKLDTTNSCVSNLNVVYSNLSFFAEDSKKLTLNKSEFANKLRDNFKDNSVTAAIIYGISYVTNYSDNDTHFSGFSHNFANILLNKDYGEITKTFMNTYSCLRVKNNSLPIAHFKDIDNFFGFMKGRLNDAVVSQINNIGISKYYACYWPTKNIDESYYDSNPIEFSELNTRVLAAINDAIRLKLIDKPTGDKLLNGEKPISLGSETSGGANDVNETNNISDSKCELPTINKFWPNEGVSGTIVNINGSGFKSVINIKFDDVNLKPTDFTIFNDISIRIVVPSLTPNQDKSVNIELNGINGNVTSTNKFMYKSEGSIVAASAGPTTN
jgi:hypothetical protein